MTPRTPSLTWAQHQDIVFLVAKFHGIDKCTPTVTIDRKKVAFSCSLGEDNYAFELELFADVMPDKSSHKLCGIEYEIKLRKLESTDWPRIAKDAKLKIK